MTIAQVLAAFKALGLDPATVDEVLFTKTSEARYVIVTRTDGSKQTHRVEG